MPWITIREKPGNIILTSPSELIKKLNNTNEVIITYAADTWISESFCKNLFNDASKDSLVILVSSIGQPEPGSYDDKDELIGGSLEEHFSARASYERGRSYVEAKLLIATIELISAAWSIDTSELNSSWIRNKRKLYGNIKRSN